MALVLLFLFKTGSTQMVAPFGWYLKGCHKGANHFSGPTVLRTIREKGCQGCKDTVSLQEAGVQDGFRWNFSLVILYQCHLLSKRTFCCHSFGLLLQSEFLAQT